MPTTAEPATTPTDPTAEHLECLNKLAAIERAIDLAETEIR